MALDNSSHGIKCKNETVEGAESSKAVKGSRRGGFSFPRGPRSAYTLFYQCARKQLAAEKPDLSFREFPTICSQLWKDMDPKERELWQQDAARDKERYNRELLELARKQAEDGASATKTRRKRRKNSLTPGTSNDEHKSEKSLRPSDVWDDPVYFGAFDDEGDVPLISPNYSFGSDEDTNPPNTTVADSDHIGFFDLDATRHNHEPAFELADTKLLCDSPSEHVHRSLSSSSDEKV